MNTDIYGLLCQLGITANYKGFFHTSYAVQIVLNNPDQLLLVTKSLYPSVARHCKTSWHCVERNIRTVSKLAWLRNRPLLEQMAHTTFPVRPSASAFLAILAAYLRHNYPT